MIGDMANKRGEIAMSSDEIRDFLEAGATVQLALNGPDGYPDITPMWYVVQDGVLWMRTYGKSQKVVNARRDPRCCALIESGDRYLELRGVQITGDLDLVTDVERICWVAARLMVKYEAVEAEHIPALEAAYAERAPKQVAMGLSLDRIVSWDHRKMAAQ
jgi:PPOX class probable F420-dependent enzyme